MMQFGSESLSTRIQQIGFCVFILVLSIPLLYYGITGIVGDHALDARGRIAKGKIIQSGSGDNDRWIYEFKVGDQTYTNEFIPFSGAEGDISITYLPDDPHVSRPTRSKDSPTSSPNVMGWCLTAVGTLLCLAGAGGLIVVCAGLRDR